MTAFAQETSLHAGITRSSIEAEVPFETLVWYPTQTDETPWQAGPFTISATRDAPVASGKFPIILLSHGGGRGGGNPLILRYLSGALARHGFIVVAPFHQKTALPGRALQVRQSLDFVLADPRFGPHADQKRIGMLGFSLGGAVTLELSGAVPNAAHLITYCASHPGDGMSCRNAPDGKNVPSQDSARKISWPPPLPLKAAVLFDPFSVLFQGPELVAVTLPVLIFRPSQSELPGEANAFGLKAALPYPPEFQNIPGSHFVFTDVCPPALKSDSPEVCQDPPGADRSAVHDVIENQIIAFFNKNM